MEIDENFYSYDSVIQLKITPHGLEVSGDREGVGGKLRLDATKFIFVASDRERSELPLPFTQHQCSLLVNMLKDWLPQIQTLHFRDPENDLRLGYDCMVWLTNNGTIRIHLCSTGKFKFSFSPPRLRRIKFELSSDVIKGPAGILYPGERSIHKYYTAFHALLREEQQSWTSHLSARYANIAPLTSDDDDDDGDDENDDDDDGDDENDDDDDDDSS